MTHPLVILSGYAAPVWFGVGYLLGRWLEHHETRHERHNRPPPRRTL